jgi:hypothetical protein
MGSRQLYDLLVLKRGEEPRVLERGLEKKEAIEAKESWLKVYNPEVFLDPVPQLKVVPSRGD